MRRHGQILTAFLFLALIIVAPVGFAATSLTADEIIDQMEKNTVEIEDLTATINIQAYKNGGVSLTQRVRLSLLQPDKMRLDYLAPEYLAGNVTIIVGDKMRMYIAAMDKWFEKDLSSLSPAEQPWLMFRNLLRGVRSELDDYTFTRLGDEGDAYHIRGLPASDAAVYGRIDLWVNTKTFVPVRRVLYDVDGNLLVDARFLDATVINDVLTLPLRIKTYNADGELKNVIAYEEIAVNTGVPDALFNPPEKSDG